MSRYEDDAGMPAFAEPCIIPTIAVSGVASRQIVGDMWHVALYVDKVVFDERGPRAEREICLRFAMPIGPALKATADAATLASLHTAAGEDMAPPPLRLSS